MRNKKEQVKKGTVDNYIKEFNRLLAILEQQGRNKPASGMSLKEDDATYLRNQLDVLRVAQEEGKGGLPILRTSEEWSRIEQIQRAYASFNENNLQRNPITQDFKSSLDKIKDGTTHDTAPREESGSTKSYTTPSPFDISKGPKFEY